MFGALQNFFSQDVGIDLGTANTVVHVRGRGVVIQEPSVVARNKITGSVIAIGIEAKRMVGKTPGAIETIRPLRDGVIADFDAAEAMLDHYLQRIRSNRDGFGFSRPRVVIGIPSGVTEVERRAVQSAAISSGAWQAYLIEEPMAAAIGAGLNVEEPEGRMIVDIGGGTTEIAVISLGGIVLNTSLRVAGDEFDEAVVSFARTRHGLLIGEATAEQTKIAIGSAYPFEETLSKKHAAYAVIRGRDVESGLPKSVKVQSVELREALSPVVQQIITAILETLEETPPELVADIMKQGIALAGGSSQLRGLERRISEETTMPVWSVHEPHLAVVRGCAIVLEKPALLKKATVSWRSR
ncbi:MAG TPA: rod shape-determining protein [Patescibacteria group bacterium]|nr:rod shape-determining protein [Patescibacteria group bacterium]